MGECGISVGDLLDLLHFTGVWFLQRPAGAVGRPGLRAGHFLGRHSHSILRALQGHGDLQNDQP